MKTIRFWTSHYITDPGYWSRRLELSTSEYKFVFDPDNPEWLFGSEHLYIDANKMRFFLQMLLPTRLSLYFAGEAIEPDLNLFDYAVAHDPHAANMDRVARCPVFTFNNYDENVFPDFSRGIDDAPSFLRTKTGFCSFLYANPIAHPRRDWLFHALSSYKHVDALGPHLHNCDLATSRKEPNWKRLAIRLKSSYKFDIAAENARYFGYTTEKIMTAFAAGTVPIYWGNPLVAEEFNPQAFINANGMEVEELIETVRRIDSDNDLWCHMVSLPPMTEFQTRAAILDLERYRTWSVKIFSQTPEEGGRRPEGTWANLYRRTFQRRRHFLLDAIVRRARNFSHRFR